MASKHLTSFFFFLGMLLIVGACAPRQETPSLKPDEFYSPSSALPSDSGVSAEAGTSPESPRAPSMPKKQESQGDIIIGMLVPLSGPQADIGQQLRDAALLGLYDKQKSLTRMEMIRNPRLVVRDSGTDKTQLIAATEELIEQGARIILGPLMAQDVRIASEVTQKHNIPLLSFSNSEQVAKPGVYVFGFDPAEQIRRVASYALNAQISHFAALTPQSDYGRKVVQQLSSQLAVRNIALQPVEFFSEGQPPSPMAMNRLLTTLKDWGNIRKALFLPMTGKALADTSLVIMTHKNIGAPFIKLLGTGLWDDPQITAIPALQGAWFATSNPSNTAKFKEKFSSTYGYTPMRIASLGYDAVALATTLALENGETAFTPKTLHDKEGFNGPANGIFRLLPTGRVERLLAVVEIGNGSFYVIDPAPKQF